MRKQIKKWGNALIISFSAEEKAIYNIKEGDICHPLLLFKILSSQPGKQGREKAQAHNPSEIDIRSNIRERARNNTATKFSRTDVFKREET